MSTMLKSLLLILASFLILFGCSERKKEITYFENGNVQFEVYLDKNGKREGKSFEYFKTGKLKAVQEWKNGEANGKGLHYNENGNLKLEVNWKNDLEDGELKAYHSNGKIKLVGKYELGERIGFFSLFSENGERIAWQYFGEPGELYDYATYDSLGNLKQDDKKAIVHLNRDTFELHDTVSLIVHLSNNVNKTRIIVGDRYVSESPGVEPVLGIIHEDSINNGCQFKIEATKKGENKLVGYISDSLNLNDKEYLLESVPFQANFYVR